MGLSSMECNEYVEAQVLASLSVMNMGRSKWH